jgi:CBS domain-containing protein/uncharacterized protein (DUF2267 family)
MEVRQPKLVVLQRGATAYEAARAMADNHVGAVLVVHHHKLTGVLTDRDLALAVARDGFDPHATRLGEVMTSVVVTCEEGASVDDILLAMKQYAVRRVPLVRDGKPAGLVTLDDLLLDAEVPPAELRAVVAAQLAQPARLKPAGEVRPSIAPSAPPPDRGRSARAEATYRALVRAVAVTAGSRDRAEDALGIVFAQIRRRLDSDDAERLLAHLPPRLSAALELAPDGPDPSVTIDTIASELRRRLDLLPDAATDILLAVCEALHDAGVFAERLPCHLREMFPSSATSRMNMARFE